MKLSYRPEIDVLKVIAAVIIFSARFPDSIVHTGAINIFFVISGFFAMQMIQKDSNIFNFLKARLESLFPLYFISCLGILILYLIFGDFNYYHKVLLSFKWSLVGMFNIFLERQEIKYGDNTFFNPFLPFWFMSVLIQFYIAFPFIYKIVSFKSSSTKILFKRIALLSALMFVIYILIDIYYPNKYITSYTAIFSRLWQFFLGSSLFLFLTTRKICNESKVKALLFSALLLVLWQFDLKVNDLFYLQTLSTSLIGVFVIYSSNATPSINNQIFFNIFKHLGSYSYSFYLWQMLAISVAHTYFYYSFNIYTISITLSIFFSFAVHHCVKKINIKNKYVLLSFFLMWAIALSLSKFYQEEIVRRAKEYNYYEKNIENFKKIYTDTKQTYTALKDEKGIPCFTNEGSLNLSCNFNQNKKDKVILLGSSHMAVFAKELTETLISQGYNVHSITRGGYCPFVPPFYNKNNNHCTKESMDILMKYLMASKKSTIVLSQRFPLYLSGNLYKNSKGFNEKGKPPEIVSDKNTSIVDSFNETIKLLTNYGHNLILVYPIPEFAEDIPQFYKKNFFKVNFQDLKEPRAFYDKRVEESFKLLDSIKSKNIERIYPSDFLCDDNYCYSMINNKILYSDDDHLNQNGVNLIAPEIIKRVNKLSLQDKK